MIAWLPIARTQSIVLNQYETEYVPFGFSEAKHEAQEDAIVLEPQRLAFEFWARAPQTVHH